MYVIADTTNDNNKDNQATIQRSEHISRKDQSIKKAASFEGTRLLYFLYELLIYVDIEFYASISGSSFFCIIRVNRLCFTHP